MQDKLLQANVKSSSSNLYNVQIGYVWWHSEGWNSPRKQRMIALLCFKASLRWDGSNTSHSMASIFLRSSYKRRSIVDRTCGTVSLSDTACQLSQFTTWAPYWPPSGKRKFSWLIQQSLVSGYKNYIVWFRGNTRTVKQKIKLTYMWALKCKLMLTYQ